MAQQQPSHSNSSRPTHHRSSKRTALILILALSVTGLPGCVPLVWMAANPAVAGAIASSLAAIVGAANMWRLASSGNQQAESQKEEVEIARGDLKLRGLQEETARISAEASLLQAQNQQHALELEEKKLRVQTLEASEDSEDPAIRAELDEVREEVETGSDGTSSGSDQSGPPDSPDLVLASRESSNDGASEQLDELAYRLEAGRGLAVAPGSDSEDLFANP